MGLHIGEVIVHAAGLDDQEIAVDSGLPADAQR
jgi:hypothetical protein